ncbi:xanthine dehydrogenase small subunit [Aquabacterium sp.]|uniref:xanthine dehydrogenase small subunit n=1 Tax=Aquabacterium sp. TaxID=1872578 RepID=UPI0035AE0034
MSAPNASQPSRPIRFVHHGQVQEVSGVPATTTVLQWLREAMHCTGTKEGCAEGDCGACTVVVGERDAQGQWQQRTVNSCIQLLPTLDGKALLTVEDVPPAASGQLHPCQDALVQCHGSQCGFCTPGFVMSLWHLYETHDQAPSRGEMADALAGNLCRCTGYRPIVDAGQQMFEAPRVAFDPAPLLQALVTLSAQSDLVYEGPDPAQPGQTTRFYAPTTLDALARLRADLPQARLLAGGTDIGLWVTKQFRALGDVIYLGRVAALQTIQTVQDANGQTVALEVGAGVTLEDAWSTLAALVPALRELWLRFASPPVRHAGTLAGNLANGSPIGDSAPILLALGASLVLRRGEAERVLPLDHFYLDYMRNDLQPGEWVQSVRIPLPTATPGTVMRAYKLSKRRDSDISAVCAGFQIRIEGDTIVEARLGWGGMAATAKRASHTEAALLGRPWNDSTLQAARAALSQDFQPMTDLRATQDYRLRTARNLLTRFYLETRPLDPLSADRTQIWPAHV